GHDRIVGVRSVVARVLLPFGPGIAAFGGSILLAESLLLHEQISSMMGLVLTVFTAVGLALMMIVTLKKPMLTKHMSEPIATKGADFILLLVDISEIEIRPPAPDLF